MIIYNLRTMVRDGDGWRSHRHAGTWHPTEAQAVAVIDQINRDDDLTPDDPDYYREIDAEANRRIFANLTNPDRLFLDRVELPTAPGELCALLNHYQPEP